MHDLKKKERTKTLEDGTVLVYRRPGAITFDNIGVRAAKLEAAKRAAAAAPDADGETATEKPAAAPGPDPAESAQSAFEQFQLLRAEKKRIRLLPKDERQKAHLDNWIDNLSPLAVILECAASWTALPDGEITKDGLGDLTMLQLQEASEVIIRSHYDRAEEHAKN